MLRKSHVDVWIVSKEAMLRLGHLWGWRRLCGFSSWLFFPTEQRERWTTGSEMVPDLQQNTAFPAASYAGSFEMNSPLILFTKSMLFFEKLETDGNCNSQVSLSLPSSATDQYTWVTMQHVCCSRGWCLAKELSLHFQLLRKKTWENRLRIDFAA